MKCAVIGGGAAGLMAACVLAKGGAEVTVLERQVRVGKKLLATGNGRCNFTNLNIDPSHYHGSFAGMEAFLRRFTPERIMAEFAEMGVPGAADAQGRVYPASNTASSVLDALRLTLFERGGRERTGFEVSSVRPEKGGFTLRTADGDIERCQYLLVACGGAAAPKQGGVDGGYRILKQLGHEIAPVKPVIAPLNTDTASIKGLKGMRVRCKARLIDGDREVRTESGEALFTDYGLSGICIMQLARDVHALQRPAVSLDLAEGFEETGMFARARMLGQRPLEDFLNGLIQRRLGWNVLRAAGISDMSRQTSSLSRREISAIWRALRDFRVNVKSVCALESAQATAGGAHMSGFDEKTLMSKRVPGLFAAGEVCDVDGDCGGYNLHWAWSSALAAAEAMLSF